MKVSGLMRKVTLKLVNGGLRLESIHLRDIESKQSKQDSVSCQELMLSLGIHVVSNASSFDLNTAAAENHNDLLRMSFSANLCVRNTGNPEKVCIFC